MHLQRVSKIILFDQDIHIMGQVMWKKLQEALWFIQKFISTFYPLTNEKTKHVICILEGMM